MIIPITNMLGGDQKAWIMFSAGLAVVSAILLFVTYKTSKEYALKTVRRLRQLRSRKKKAFRLERR